MIEWVLVLMFTLNTNPGEVRDIAPQLLQGFSSEEKCKDAGNAIAHQMLVLAGRIRAKQGIDGGSPRSAPVVYFECLRAEK